MAIAWLDDKLDAIDEKLSEIEASTRESAALADNLDSPRNDEAIVQAIEALDNTLDDLGRKLDAIESNTSGIESNTDRDDDDEYD